MLGRGVVVVGVTGWGCTCPPIWAGDRKDLSLTGVEIPPMREDRADDGADQWPPSMRTITQTTIASLSLSNGPTLALSGRRLTLSNTAPTNNVLLGARSSPLRPVASLAVAEPI